MKHFDADHYAKNAKYLNITDTYFISEGFDLQPLDINPWRMTKKRNDDNFKIAELYRIVDFITPDGIVIRIPKGFQFDGASIPKFAQSIIGKPFAKYALAALLHDWLYSSRILGDNKKGRLYADLFFLEVMEQLDISWWRRKAMYRAVRLGGSKAYFKSNEVDYCKSLFKTIYNPWKDYKKHFQGFKANYF